MHLSIFKTEKKLKVSLIQIYKRLIRDNLKEYIDK